MWIDDGIKNSWCFWELFYVMTEEGLYKSIKWRRELSLILLSSCLSAAQDRRAYQWTDVQQQRPWRWEKLEDFPFIHLLLAYSITADDCPPGSRTAGLLSESTGSLCVCWGSPSCMLATRSQGPCGFLQREVVSPCRTGTVPTVAQTSAGTCGC